MSDEMKRVFAALDRNLWEGLQEYAAHRIEQRKGEAISAKEWEPVLRAQGADEELRKLSRLQSEFETYVRERNTAMKKE